MTGSPLALSALPNQPVIEVFRSFDAPVASVFSALTTPDLVRRWRDLSACEVDLRVGGAYRYVLRDGNVVDGCFVEIEPPIRLVTNYVLDSLPDDTVVEVTSLSETTGRTAVRIVSLHSSCSARDRCIAAVEKAMADAFERLDELLAAARE
jgi:uncharacterized protein YndB with AHSA1/START domain